jgi:hypothetical protein
LGADWFSEKAFPPFPVFFYSVFTISFLKAVSKDKIGGYKKVHDIDSFIGQIQISQSSGYLLFMVTMLLFSQVTRLVSSMLHTSAGLA